VERRWATTAKWLLTKFRLRKILIFFARGHCTVRKLVVLTSESFLKRVGDPDHSLIGETSTLFHTPVPT
jgi:hypothetical protein